MKCEAHKIVGSFFVWPQNKINGVTTLPPRIKPARQWTLKLSVYSLLLGYLTVVPSSNTLTTGTRNYGIIGQIPVIIEKESLSA